MSEEPTGLTEVTGEQFKAIRADLEALLDTKQKPNEDLPTYARRLVEKAGDPKFVTDSEFDSLKELTQEWVNGGVAAIEGKQEFPLPPDEDDASDGDDDAAEDASSSEAEEEEAAMAATTRKAPAKKAAAKKTAAKKAPAKKAATKKTAAKKTNGAARGRPALFSLDAKITPLKKQNPYRDGSKGAGWYGKYKKGMTVEAAVKAGVPRAQVRFDLNHGNISVK